MYYKSFGEVLKEKEKYNPFLYYKRKERKKKKEWSTGFYSALLIVFMISLSSGIVIQSTKLSGIGLMLFGVFGIITVLKCIIEEIENV